MAASEAVRKAVVRIVFLSLLLDLLAFTLPLPLFPRLIASFVEGEKNERYPTVLSRTLSLVRSLRGYLFSFRATQRTFRPIENAKWDITLLGGLLGSLFSACQFLISPWIGSLSDRYGRRPVLLATMLGNILSAALWLFATDFGTYLLSRAVGGLSEGNVQLAIAIISDVSDAQSRGKCLALVGIAFSLCFTVGPSLGAWFATRSAGTTEKPVAWLGRDWNVYAVPAAISLGLLVVETVYLAAALPETRPVKNEKVKTEKPAEKAIAAKADPVAVEERLASLRRLHLLFLLIFSGAEFTLTFLTYDLYSFSNAQNGRVLGFIGVLSSLLQGGLTRRSSRPPADFVTTGISACVISMALLASLPYFGSSSIGSIGRSSSFVLYAASAGLAYVSASVVNALNTLASLECDKLEGASSNKTDAPSPTTPTSGRGQMLGRHRSAGQLGRALGPLVATALYWTNGPTTAYGTCAIAMAGVRVLAASSGLRTSRRGEIKRKAE